MKKILLALLLSALALPALADGTDIATTPRKQYTHHGKADQTITIYRGDGISIYNLRTHKTKVIKEYTPVVEEETQLKSEQQTPFTIGAGDNLWYVDGNGYLKGCWLRGNGYGGQVAVCS